MDRDWSLTLIGEGVSSLTAPFTFHHGFTGAPLSFREPHLKASAQKFLSSLQGSKLLLLKQTHTANVLFLNGAERVAPKGESLSKIFDQYPGSQEVFLTRAESDAIIFPARDLELRGCVIGVRTADCLPLIIACGDWLALVHAGWRGLAAGIIEQTLAAIVELASDPASREVDDFKEDETKVANLRVAIGPAISGAVYEVGSDVVDAVAGWEVVGHLESTNPKSPNRPEKWLLDLSEVAKRRISTLYPAATISHCDICTLANANFHSFRRDKQNMGSNLAWVAIGA